MAHRAPASSAYAAFVFLSVSACVLGPSSPARADWLPDGNPVCTAAGNQVNVSACTDGSGAAIVVWTDYRDYPTHPLAVFAQRVNGDGTLAWTPGGVRIGPTQTCSAVNTSRRRGPRARAAYTDILGFLRTA